MKADWVRVTYDLLTYIPKIVGEVHYEPISASLNNESKCKSHDLESMVGDAKVAMTAMPAHEGKL